MLDNIIYTRLRVIMSRFLEATASDWYEPAARFGHVAAAIDEKLYVWGGFKKDMPEVHGGTCVVDILDLQAWVWRKEHTTGSPPQGVGQCGFTLIDRRIVVYGGNCGNCWHNSLHELDTTRLNWEELASSQAKGCPMEKGDCGMVAYSSDGKEHLCVFGGCGTLTPASQQPTAEYFEDPKTSGFGWTNEFHCFTAGCWSSPTVTGIPPPPCSAFSFTKVSKERVLMFGGYKAGLHPVRMDYIYTLSFKPLHWTRSQSPVDGNVPWPVKRCNHSSCLLDPLTGHQDPVVLVTGGQDDNIHILSELWILKNENTWKKIFISEEAMVKRQRHTAVSISVSSNLVVVVMFGDNDDYVNRQKPMSANTSVLEFELQQSVLGEEEWVLTRTADLRVLRALEIIRSHGKGEKELKAKEEQLKAEEKHLRVEQEQLNFKLEEPGVKFIAALVLKFLFNNHAIFAVLLVLIVAGVLLPLNNIPASDPSIANLRITSVSSLLSELPVITDPIQFCVCLRVPYFRCRQIATDHQGSINSQVMEIAAVWYSRSQEPSWDEVVDALYCHEQYRLAKKLAEEKGVDWRPLSTKWQEHLNKKY